MTRRIITAEPSTAQRALATSESSCPTDGYLSRIVKYIPSEIIALFLLVDAAAQSLPTLISTPVYFTIFGVFLVATPIYIAVVTRVPGAPASLAQILIAPLSFAAWVFGFGGPFARLDWYTPILGAVVALAVTLLAGFVVPKPIPVKVAVPAN